MIDPILALGAVGAPTRQYMLSDLLLDECNSSKSGWGRHQRDVGGTTGTTPPTQQQPLARSHGQGCIDVDGLRLAVFTNAHVLTPAAKAAITLKLARRNVTLLFLYAAGIINESGAADPLGMKAATGLDALVRGDGALALNVTMSGSASVSGWFGIGLSPADPVDPWFHLGNLSSLPSPRASPRSGASSSQDCTTKAVY